jgi:hypothetical protein
MIQTGLLTLILSLSGTPLLQNGDFVEGLQGWGGQNDWYARPPGTGVSPVCLDEQGGRDAGPCLRIDGEGKRGLALQRIPIVKGPYRASVWIRCEDMANSEAGLLLEWLAADGSWLQGDLIGAVRDTTEWTRVEGTVTPPANARFLHVDLLTTEPTSGTAWFDDVSVERAAQDLPAPKPPVTTATRGTPAAPNRVRVSWVPEDLSPGTVYLVFREQTGAEESPVPRGVYHAEDGSAELDLHATDGSSLLTVQALSFNGLQSSSVELPVPDPVPVEAAPRPGTVLALRTQGSTLVRVGWWPHVLPPAAVRVGVCAQTPDGVEELGDAAARQPEAPALPVFTTEPEVEVTVATDRERLGVWAESRAGRRSPVQWIQVHTRPGTAADALPADLWSLPPTENVHPQAQGPTAQASPFRLTIQPGQSRSFQIVLRPHVHLHAMTARSRGLSRLETGDVAVPPVFISTHRVLYVELAANSVATPPEELVWQAPAEYPDQLDDAPVFDLAAERTHPLFVRVHVPHGTPAGLYTGTIDLEADEGRAGVRFEVRVSSVPFPERTHLTFAYWFSWEDVCSQFKVDPFSDEAWHLLDRLARLMADHHQNSVLVPWSLVQTWQEATGEMIHDFSRFDRFVETFRRQGVDRLFCLGHIGSRATGDWECPTMVPADQSVVDLVTGMTRPVSVLEILPAISDHIGERGWRDRFAVHVADEPLEANVESYRRLSAAVRAATGGLPRIDAVHTSDLDDALEIWVPQIDIFERWYDTYQEVQDRPGHQLWFYVAWVPQGHYPNRLLDIGAIKPRILHWLHGLYNTEGYLHWALNRWSLPLTMLDSPGDQYVCWPSTRFVANGSLRYEAEREGLEDCELIAQVRRLLRERGLGEEASDERIRALLAPVVRNGQDYTRSWYELEAVRTNLLAILEGQETP